MSLEYKVTTSSGNLNVRKSPTTSSSIMYTLAKGKVVTLKNITIYNESWYQLNDGNYANKTFLTKVDNSDIETADSTITAYDKTGKISPSSTLIYTKNDRNTSSGILITKNAIVQIDKKSTNGFYHITSPRLGWIFQSVVIIVNSNGKTTTPVSKSSVEYQEAVNRSTTFENEKNAVTKKVTNIDYSDYTSTEKLLVKTLGGIHGIPYQFMANVDSRYTTKTNIGRKYAERIVSKMPLLLMTPGGPDFLPSYSKKEKGIIVSSLVNISKGKGITKTNLNKILNTTGRYYTFKFEFAEYYKYVNRILAMCSIYLGLEDNLHSNGGSNGYSAKLSNFNWAYAVNKELKGFINSQEYVAFYLDSETSISESFSTSTTESGLKSSLDEASGISKELQFLAGPIMGLQVEALDLDNFEATEAEMKKIVNDKLGGSKLFNNLAEMFTTVGKGGKIAFPEIWEDTEFSKSYDISLKLRTPDGDKLSWFLNICVPLIHMLCLAAPRQLGANGYKSPFLVRAYYKGIFNCDMGIITNMSITKGKESAWTADGLPTEVDISITLKDLYSLLTISKTEVVRNFMNNTCLMDYLANTCGININKPEISRTLETYVLLTKNTINNLYSNKWLELQNGLSNLAAKAYKNLW